MKNALLKSIFFIAVIGLLFSCNQKVESDSDSNYLTDTETGVKTGGIKVVTISTPSLDKENREQPKDKNLIIKWWSGCYA